MSLDAACPFSEVHFHQTHTKEKTSPEARSFHRESETYTLKLDPQPQVLFTWGLSNLKPAASSVST